VMMKCFQVISQVSPNNANIGQLRFNKDNTKTAYTSLYNLFECLKGIR